MNNVNEECFFLGSFSVKGCITNDEINKISPKDSNTFFINFKDSSGTFLNDTDIPLKPYCALQINKSSPLLQNHMSPEDVNEADLKQIDHDHDYTKSTGPQKFHEDKGNIFLTVNLTEYSKVIDIKSIGGVVLLLNNQLQHPGENNANTNEASRSVNGADPTDENGPENKLVSVNEDGSVNVKFKRFIRCEFCKDDFEMVREYKTHLKERHKNTLYNMCKPYFCELCDKEFTSKDIFLKHLRAHEGILCNVCAERFGSKEEFRAHVKHHPKKYFCEICNKGFREKYLLKAHAAVHNDLYSFFCDVCHQGFKAKGNLTHHMMRHNKIRKFICDKCPNMFYNESRLLNHQRVVHDKIKPFDCPDCDKKFAGKSNLYIHQRVMHLKLKPHQCEFCGRQFAKTDALANHRRIHTGTPRRPNRNKQNAEKPVRGKRKENDAIPIIPTKLNNTPVDCDICGRTLKNVTYLKRHLNTHARIRKFKCGFCGLMFLHRTSKIQHEKAHAADPEHKFVCPSCWKRCKTKEELDLHVNQHNNRLKRHKCEVCGEAFCRRILLDNHMLSEHTDEEEIGKREQEIIVDGILQALNKL